MAQAAVQSDAKLVKTLASASIALWFASLFMVSFLTLELDGTYLGLFTLAFGTLFGWMVAGFAVYANPFFLYAACKLRCGGLPKRAVLVMVVLALSLPFFKGVLWNEGPGTIRPVVSWGWGAVCWILAIYVVTVAAALRGGVIGRRGTFVAMFIALGVLLGLCALHLQQASQANLQERAKKISPFMAFTVEPLCGIQVAWPDSPVVPEGAYVRVEHDPELLRGSAVGLYFAIPSLLRYELDGIDFTRHTSAKEPHLSLAVRSPASSKRYVLSSRTTAQGALIRILDEQEGGRVLYEQEMKVSWEAGKRSVCPGLKGPFGIEDALARALGQETPAQFPSADLVDSVARERCDLSFGNTQEPGGRQTPGRWDGKEVELWPESIRSRPGFCSERYAGLVYVSSNPDASKGLGSNLLVFDRQTLQPIAAFNDATPCAKGARCKDVSHAQATGFRIEKGQATVETTAGDLVVQKRLR
jgi:hypothetical protein